MELILLLSMAFGFFVAYYYPYSLLKFFRGDIFLVAAGASVAAAIYAYYKETRAQKCCNGGSEDSCASKSTSTVEKTSIIFNITKKTLIILNITKESSQSHNTSRFSEILDEDQLKTLEKSI